MDNNTKKSLPIRANDTGLRITQVKIKPSKQNKIQKKKIESQQLKLNALSFTFLNKYLWRYKVEEGLKYI